MTISVCSIRPCVPRVPYLDSMISCRLASISWVLGDSDSGRLFGRDLTAAVAQSRVSVVWTLSNSNLDLSAAFSSYHHQVNCPHRWTTPRTGSPRRGLAKSTQALAATLTRAQGPPIPPAVSRFQNSSQSHAWCVFPLQYLPSTQSTFPSSMLGPIMECSI